MSLLAIIFIAIVIPFVIIGLGFIWFYIRSRIAKMSAPPKQRPYRSQTVQVSPVVASKQAEPVISQFTSKKSKPAVNYKPTYRPLSHFLESSEEVATIEESIQGEDNLQELTVIPGITNQIQRELHELGYHSIEQIARWGRADVRAVSGRLEMDQQVIEEVWVANARLILAVRSTSYTS